MIVFDENAPKVIGFTPTDDFEFEIVETPEYVQGETSEYIIDDAVYQRGIPTGLVNNAHIEFALPVGTPVYSASSNNAVAAMDAVHKITYVSDGDVEIYVGKQNGIQKRVKRTMESGAGTVNQYDLQSFVAGSLSAHVKSQIEGLIAGHTPGRDVQEYMLSTNADIDTPSVTISDHPFIGQFDFSGVSVMGQPAAGVQEDEYPAMLVTPRHALIAKHVSTGLEGKKFAFRRLDGTYQTVTVSGRYVVSDNNDLAVIMFDVDVTGCTIYQTMPYRWEVNYSPSLTYSADSERTRNTAIPYIRKAQHLSSAEKWVSAVVINHLYRAGDYPLFISSNSFTSIRNTPTNPPQTGEIPRAWGVDEAIGGDSAGPSFLVINGELILISSQFTETYTPNISEYTDEINTAINDLAGVAQGTYALTHPDLSSFTDYSI